MGYFAEVIMVYAVLFILEAVFTCLFIRAGYPEATKKGFAFKMIASSVFVINGVYSALPFGSRFPVLIVTALALGLAGDIFLTFDPFIKDKNDKKKSAFFILLGGAFFLAGHVVYMVAFAGEIKAKSAFSPLIFALGIILGIAGIFALILFSRVKPGKAIIPIGIYAAAISAMFALGLCLALGAYAGSPAAKIILIAAPVLFIISDSSLLLEFFDKERFNNMTVRSINLGTYFLAQMLFGLAAKFVG